MSAAAEAVRPPFAYVLLWFPKLSETFVVDELLAMERLGLHPLIVARGYPDGEKVNARAASLLHRTTWLTRLAWWRQLLIAARTSLCHPLRLSGCLRVIVPLRSRRALVNLWHGLL